MEGLYTITKCMTKIPTGIYTTQVADKKSKESLKGTVLSSLAPRVEKLNYQLCGCQ